MKKFLAIALALVMVLGLAACGSTVTTTDTPSAPAATTPAPSTSGGGTTDAAPATATSITLWTYPIGGWQYEDQVKALTDPFTAATGITVNVEYLTYADGDDKVNTALTANQAPDLVMEGPERLVTNWGAKGYMVDLSDLWDSASKSEIYSSIESACKLNGAYYEYPLCMIAHCMAVNVDRFKAAGVADVLDLDTHTWTTDDFIKAVNALYANGDQNVGAIFCGGQGGDQGTRALINNLYGGTFTTADHSKYTWDDAANLKALKELYDLNGINYDPSIAGGDEIQLFRQGILDMAFCWNVQQQVNSDNNAAGLTNDGDEIAFMAFPSDDGKAELCGGIWGFGIFDSGDDARIAAAKEFVKYFANGAGTPDAVKASTFLPVRDSAAGNDLTKLFADDPITTEYIKILPMMGDYYQVVPGWAEARTAWWNMLQQIGAGDGSEASIKATVDQYLAEANANT